MLLFYWAFVCSVLLTADKANMMLTACQGDVTWTATNLDFVLCSCMFCHLVWIPPSWLPFWWLSCMTLMLYSQTHWIWPAWTFWINTCHWFWPPFFRTFPWWSWWGWRGLGGFCGMNLFFGTTFTFSCTTHDLTIPSSNHFLVVAPPSLPCSPPSSCLDPSHSPQASPLHKVTHRSRDDGGAHSQGEPLCLFGSVHFHLDRLVDSYFSPRVC